MRVCAIVAVAENGVIGKDNALPWHLPADLKYFRSVTTGHPIILGRKNYQSIGKPLPNRTNIVLSRDAGFEAPGCLRAGDLQEALEIARSTGAQDCFVVGGAEVYRQALPLCSRLYLTQVHAEISGDVYMPELGEGWEQVSCEYHAADEKNSLAFSFILLERGADGSGRGAQ